MNKQWDVKLYILINLHLSPQICHGGGRGFRAQVCACHRAMRHQSRAGGREVCEHTAGPHPHQGQLRRAGGHRRHQGMLVCFTVLNFKDYTSDYF